MIHENWAYVAVALNLVGTVLYIRDVLRGSARPNRISWFVLSLAPLLAFSAMVAEGVMWKQALFTFIVGFCPFLIFLSSFVAKHPAWKLEKRDLVCAVLSVIGLILWKLSGEGAVAIIFGILADGLAFLPTLIKAYTNPETESYPLFLLGIMANMFNFAILTSYDFAHLAFPVYILIADALAFIFIYFKIGTKLKTL